MKMLLALIFASLRCFCSHFYDFSIVGLMEHDFGQDDSRAYRLLQQTSISRALDNLDCNLESFHNYTDSYYNSVCTLVDYDAVKGKFHSDLLDDYSAIVRLNYNLHNSNDPMGIHNEEYYASFSGDNGNSFTLETNSIEVIKFLIGRTIANCVKGFGGLRQGLVSRLRRISNIYCEIALEGFYNPSSLLDQCKSFFKNNDFDINDPKDVYESFMNFYVSNISNQQMVEDFNEYDFLYYKIALGHARDFSKLCECLRTTDKSIYNQLVHYDCNSNHIINVHKTLAINFSYQDDLTQSLGDVEIFDDNGNVVQDVSIIDIRRTYMTIKFDKLAYYRVKYIRLQLEGEDLTIDVSNFTELALENVRSVN